MNKIDVQNVGHWGRFKTFLAKIGTMPGSVIIIKGNKSAFQNGQRVWFVEKDTYRPARYHEAWQEGIIDKIEDNRLFIYYV